MQQIMHPFIAKRFSLPLDLASLQNNIRDTLESIDHTLQTIIQNNFQTINQDWKSIQDHYTNLEKYFVSKLDYSCGYII